MTTTTSTPVEDPAVVRRRWRTAAVALTLAVLVYGLGLLAEDGPLSRTDLVRGLYPALILVVNHAVAMLPTGRGSVAWRRFAGLLLVVVPITGAGLLAWVATSGLSHQGWWAAGFVAFTAGMWIIVVKRWRGYGSVSS